MTTSEPLYVGALDNITGWGALKEGGSSPLQLQAAKVPVISKEKYNDQYGTGSITSRMMCAGFPDGGIDACQCFFHVS